ncbi:MAG TPA: CoA pyrophosphatase [Vicinamibacteria bacterium]|nr:CoA pyrophosphatase [Vicinamibacteria bacterium]
MPRVDWDLIRRALASREPTRVAGPVASRAAVAVVVRESAGGLEVLFIRRADHDRDPWSGQMGFPGGRAEPGEDDLTATAVRETREETAIELARDGERLGRLDEVRAMARMRPVDLAITPFVFRLRARGDTVLSEEVRSAHWLPLDGLLSPAAQSTMQYDYQGTTLDFPCLRWDGLVIWGLTYRMFTSFQRLLEASAEAGAGLAEPLAG